MAIISTKLKKAGLFTLKEAKDLGLPQSTLSRLVTAGKIDRVARGIYVHSEYNLIDYSKLDFMIAYKKFGKSSIVGGMTALFHYGLIQQAPKQTWVIVEKTTVTHDKMYRLMRAKNVSQKCIENYGSYKMTDINRTLIDILSMSNKISVRTAIEAVKKAINNKLTTLDKLVDASKTLKKEKILKKYWEPIIGAIS